MLKILLLLLIVIAALMAWRLAARPRRDDPPVPPPPQRMVRCAECSVHLPEAEAVFADGRHFCDAAHRDAYLRRHPGN